MFYLVSYEIHAIEGGEVMIAHLVKETEEERSRLVATGAKPKKKGFAGTMDLHIYDSVLIERVKGKVGKEIDVKVVL